MRRTCLLAAVLAVAGCGYKVADCDQPTLPFSDDVELTENDVERLIQETDVNTPTSSSASSSVNLATSTRTRTVASPPSTAAT
jgi:hypothetical protein